MDIKYGQQATLTGNRNCQVNVNSNGKVDRSESVGLDRQADGFLPGLQDHRVEALLAGASPDLGGKWQVISQTANQVSYDCGDQSVWKYGGSQQLEVDLALNKVSLSTLGSKGEHTIQASFNPTSGRLQPSTIKESFGPYNSAYVSMMRDMY